MDFIFSPNEKRKTAVELEETFVPDDSEDATPSQMGLIQRIRHESKTDEHTQHEAIRVNLITRLLDEVDEMDADSEGDEGVITFGEKVAYNTLFHYGFLKRV